MWWSHGQSKDPVELGGKPGGVATIDRADGPDGKLNARKGKGKMHGRTSGRGHKTIAGIKALAKSRRRRKGR